MRRARDTRRSTKKYSRSPLHRTAAFLLQQPRRFSGVISPEDLLRSAGPKGFSQRCQLEGEIQTAADHSEIIPGAVNDAKTQVVSPTDMARETDFETGSELREHFSFTAKMIGLRINLEGVRRPLRVNNIPFAAAENRTYTCPCIGG